MAARDPSSVCPTGLRVLVVEDEVMISMLVEDMLVELGHQVVALASSIEEAAAIAADGDFDAALLDVDLNGQKVDGIAATLVKRGKPFAFTTGYGPRGIPQEFQDRPLLPKPYQMDQLNDVLIRVMRSA